MNRVTPWVLLAVCVPAFAVTNVRVCGLEQITYDSGCIFNTSTTCDSGYTHSQQRSANDCLQLCFSTTGCFQWVYKGTTGDCAITTNADYILFYGKNCQIGPCSEFPPGASGLCGTAIDDTTPNRCPQTFAVTEQGCLPGNTIPNDKSCGTIDTTSGAQASQGACQTKCANDPTCIGWYYHDSYVGHAGLTACVTIDAKTDYYTYQTYALTGESCCTADNSVTTHVTGGPCGNPTGTNEVCSAVPDICNDVTLYPNPPPCQAFSSYFGSGTLGCNSTTGPCGLDVSDCQLAPLTTTTTASGQRLVGNETTIINGIAQILFQFPVEPHPWAVMTFSIGNEGTVQPGSYNFTEANWQIPIELTIILNNAAATKLQTQDTFSLIGTISSPDPLLNGATIVITTFTSLNVVVVGTQSSNGAQPVFGAGTFNNETIDVVTTNDAPNTNALPYTLSTADSFRGSTAAGIVYAALGSAFGLVLIAAIITAILCRRKPQPV